MISHIYWVCLDRSDFDEASVSRNLRELSDNLRTFPTRIEVTIRTLSDEMAPAILSELRAQRDVQDTAACLVDLLYDECGAVPGLLVFCRWDSALAQRARQTNPSAQWGATCGRLAVVWEPDNKMLIWHEALHLLGAKDCYVGDREGYCEKEPECIMQWAPTEESVATWPDCLCFGTVYRLRYHNANPRGKKANLEEFIEKLVTEEEGLFWYARRHQYTISDPPSYPGDRYIGAMIGWHTKHVSRDTSFEAASADSTSFQYYGRDRSELNLPHTHMQWQTPEERMSSYTTRFSDGSRITHCHTYARQTGPDESASHRDSPQPVAPRPPKPYPYADLPATVYGTPLHQVATVGEESEADTLIAQGADINAQDEYGMTPLHEAAALGREGMATRLLGKGANVSAKNLVGDTPMHCAAWEGHASMMGLLVHHGGDLHAENDKGESPLFLAVRQKRRDAVDSLIGHGADVTSVNKKGETPLHLAAEQDDIRVAELLIDAGAEIEAESEFRETPLCRAVGHSYMVKRIDGTCDRTMIEFLLAKGANINAQDYNGRTALLHASQEGDQSMVEFLSAKGADLNVQAHDADTALHKAVENGHIEVVARLLANKADPNRQNNQGATPLQIAIDCGHEELVALLRRYEGL